MLRTGTELLLLSKHAHRSHHGPRSRFQTRSKHALPPPPPHTHPHTTHTHTRTHAHITDLVTGVYHWSVDNYGDAHTPVVGGQIAAFQGHHIRPWTITERQFANNVHKARESASAARACVAVALAGALVACA